MLADPNNDIAQRPECADEPPDAHSGEVLKVPGDGEAVNTMVRCAWIESCWW